MTSPSQFALFDIDYTLTKGGGHTFIQAHRVALREIFGQELEPNFDLTPHEGKTGSGFFSDIANERGIPRELVRSRLKDIEEYIGTYCTEHAEELGVVRMPGVEECLKRLSERGIGLGLLTGNFASIAHLKLQLAGLDCYFAFGAYGNMSEHRADLVEIARKDAERVFQKRIANNQLFIVGDSYRDMECAREAGIRAIGITTGPHSEAELIKHGAYLVIPTLERCGAIINFAYGVEYDRSRNERKN